MKSKLAASLLLAGLVGLTALCALQAGRWRTDNRPTLWIREGPDAERYARFVESFGSDETVRVRLLSDDQGEVPALAQALGPRLVELVGAVGKVLDPYRLPGGSDPARPLVTELGLRAQPRPGLRGHTDWLLALDHEATPRQREALANGLADLRQEAAAAGLELHAAGHPLLAAALDQEAQRVEALFVPLLVLFTAVVMALVLRSVVLSTLAVLVATLASLGTRATLALVGWDANLVLVAVGPLVLVLVVASVLHLVTGYRRGLAAGLAPRQAGRHARREVFPAALLAALTTSLGFGVFATSAILPVRRLGIAVALAVLVAVPLAYLVLPPLFAAFAPRAPSQKPRGPGFRRLAVRAVRARVAVIACAAALFGLGLFAGRHLEPATNALDYFPHGHPVRSSFLKFEREGTGLSTVELLVRPAKAAPKDWSERLETRLARVEGVGGVLGPDTVRRDLRFQLGPLGQLGERSALEEAGRLGGEGRTWRFTIQTHTGTSEELVRLSAKLEAAGVASLGPEAEFEVTGSLPAVLAMQAELVDTLVRSLGLTLAVVTLLFLTVVRSARAMLAVLLTNLFPVALVLGASLLLDWRLDAATTMVAAVVLGLAVDNTLHLVSAARRNRQSATPRAELRAFRQVGEAALISTVALAVGFATLALSGFVPTAHFGGLVALGALGALAADLVLLPALWIGPGRGSHRPSG